MYIPLGTTLNVSLSLNYWNQFPNGKIANFVLVISLKPLIILNARVDCDGQLVQKNLLTIILMTLCCKKQLNLISLFVHQRPAAQQRPRLDAPKGHPLALRQMAQTASAH